MRELFNARRKKFSCVERLTNDLKEITALVREKK